VGARPGFELGHSDFAHPAAVGHRRAPVTWVA
jgi:hypothetical protein